jgi:hypothetical protein
MRLLKLFALLAALTVAAAAAAQADPGRNLQAILRPTEIGPEKGFGLVKFRQPKDADTTIYLDVWVRDLAPNRTYYVQRAVDSGPGEPDGDCESEMWLTLGTIETDERGTGRASLSRTLPASLIGMSFDIHFRIAETERAAMGVLGSGCYQYTASQ